MGTVEPTRLCEYCNKALMPDAYFSRIHVSEGHFDGRMGDVLGIGIPETFRLTLNGDPIDLDTAIACVCGEDGWIVHHTDEWCAYCRRPMLLVYRGHVESTMTVPREHTDHVLMN